MSAKDNLNEAMYSVFGVGKNPESCEKEEAPAVTPEIPTPSVPVAPPRAVTYIAPGSVLEGKLRTKGDVDVAGKFSGDIHSEGHVILRSDMKGNITAGSLHVSSHLVGDINATGLVVLEEKSSVTGNISADSLECSGKVKGDLKVNGNLAMKACAVFEGNIVARTMTMEQGALVSGGVQMNNGSKPAGGGEQPKK